MICFAFWAEIVKANPVTQTSAKHIPTKQMSFKGGAQFQKFQLRTDLSPFFDFVFPNFTVLS